MSKEKYWHTSTPEPAAPKSVFTGVKTGILHPFQQRVILHIFLLNIFKEKVPIYAGLRAAIQQN